MAITTTTKPAGQHTVAEWTITILVLLFGTSTIAQPFVIPTASMHNTLLTGDRDDSLDSRYWGLVPREYHRQTADLENYNLHRVFDLATHFLTKTRWNRTLKLMHGYHGSPQS